MPSQLPIYESGAPVAPVGEDDQNGIVDTDSTPKRKSEEDNGLTEI